jgi:hypothetical protein
MNRRTALAIAAAAGGTVLTATAAFATNVGLLDTPDEPPMSVLDSSSLVGDETPLAQDPTVVTIVVEDPPAPVTAPATAPVSPPAAATASAAGGDDSAYDDSYDDDVYDDHGEDDDGEDHEDDEDDDHEDEDHEVEDDD